MVSIKYIFAFSLLVAFAAGRKVDNDQTKGMKDHVFIGVPLGSNADIRRLEATANKFNAKVVASFKTVDKTIQVVQTNADLADQVEEDLRDKVLPTTRLSRSKIHEDYMNTLKVITHLLHELN